jgi:DNA-directed RNA polymerase sigma subunit (sigma70/sigma32)
MCNKKILIDEDEKAPKKRKIDPKYHAMVWATGSTVKRPHLSKVEELDLIDAAQAGSQDAIARINASFVKYVEGLAKRIAAESHCSHLEEDMFSVGLEALQESIRDFDPKKIARFSVLLQYKSIHAMRQHALRFARPFATGKGSDERKAIFRKNDFLKNFLNLYKRPFGATSEDYKLMSDLTEIPTKALRRGFEAGDETVPVSNIAIVSPEDHAELSVLKQDRDQFLAKKVDALRKDLSSRNCAIFDALSEPESPSLVVLGAKHKISPERVGQIYRKCTETLRKNLAENGIHARSDLA